MKYDFDKPPSRVNTASTKWDHYPTSVLPMWIADMDFQTAPEIIDYLKKQVEFGIFGYTHTPEELIKITVERIRQLFQWEIQKEWIVWLPGLVPALTMACQSVGKEQDRALVLTPIYPPFLKTPSVAKRQRIDFALQLNTTQDQWIIDYDLFEKTIVQNQIKLLMLCNPHNPLGKVFDLQELNTISEICHRHQVTICSDEIHNELLLNPQKKHICIASLSKEIEDKSITLMAPSKTFNLPGLCLSFAIIPNAELRKTFERNTSYIMPHPGMLGYAGCYAAFQYGDPWKNELLNYLRENLKICMQRLSKIPQIHVLKPDATYLLWIDVRGLNLPQPERYFASQGLGLSEGMTFKGNGFLRLNFGTTRQLLLEGLSRFEKAVQALS